jgi:hypothetical protein
MTLQRTRARIAALALSIITTFAILHGQSQPMCDPGNGGIALHNG